MTPILFVFTDTVLFWWRSMRPRYKELLRLDFIFSLFFYHHPSFLVFTLPSLTFLPSTNTRPTSTSSSHQQTLHNNSPRHLDRHFSHSTQALVTPSLSSPKDSQQRPPRETTPSSSLTN